VGNILHMYMDENYQMDEKFGWKLNINELFIWKFKLIWNVWMRTIPK
jgi:hypothetical protein